MKLTKTALKAQPAIENEVPKYGTHVTDRFVTVGSDRLLATIKVVGIPFQTIDDDIIENRFDNLNGFFASLGKDKGSKLAIWTHLIRRKANTNFPVDTENVFVNRFTKKYLENFKQQDYFENSFFITLILKFDNIDDGIADLNELCNFTQKALQSYSPEFLDVYEENGLLFSKVYEFLGFLVNGFEDKIPVTATPAHKIIGSSYLHFGADLIEIRGQTPEHTKHATCYDLKEYPAQCYSGLFDPMLSLPFEFTLAQSFYYINQAKMQREIDDQLNKLTSVGDQAVHQQEELLDAKGYISTGELVFGEYAAALIVFAGQTKDTILHEKSIAKALDNGEKARAVMLGECGSLWVKATASSPYTFFSVLPGAKDRPRTFPKSSRNLAAAYTMHTMSSGKASGNPLGDGLAVMPLKTQAHGIYNLNLHFTNSDEYNVGEKVAGHTLFLGATGTGKTVAQSTIATFLMRFKPKIFAIDKDYGMKIFLKRLGGTYFDLKQGVATGLNPFQFPDTPKNREFLNQLLKECGKDHNDRITAEEEEQIKKAVDTNFSLPYEVRRFSRVIETIPLGDENSLAVRLGKWTHARNGRFAWALDNEKNALDIENISEKAILGFDVTDFLKKGYEPTGPVLATLFHLKELMQANGGLLATIVEEFWLPAQFEITQNQILDVLKTGRKRDEFIMLISQSPEDAINCPIFPAIVQQTPTKILLPNPSAQESGYRSINLTKKEFQKLKSLSETSRTFLVKQGNQSAFAVLDLYGFDDEISILSGSSDNVALLDKITTEYGDDPEVWESHFQRLRSGKKQFINHEKE